MTLDPSTSVEPTGFDPASPIARFIQGVLDIFYGPDAGRVASDPTYLRGAVDGLLDATRPPGAGERGPEAARRLVESAWASEDEGAIEFALAALHASTDCVEAYVFLGFQAGDELQIAIPFFTLGLIAGYEELGAEAFQSLAGSFWSVPQTRPFMTALAALARANRDAGAIEVAALHYQEMLRLNPNDDQGARFEIMGILLEGQDHESVAALFQVYDDGTAPFRWAATLDAFQQLGDAEASRALLDAAQAANGHVAALLAETEPFPADISTAVEPGSLDEAVLVADLQLPAWQGTEGALAWLAARLLGAAAAPGAPPAVGTLVEPEKLVAPSKEKRSGPRQV